MAQLFLNGLVTGLLLALPALALTLVFDLKFANFAVEVSPPSEPMRVCRQCAARLAAAACRRVCWCVALASIVADALVFERLRERGSITLLVASMGVSLVVENICRFFFGNAARSF